MISLAYRFCVKTTSNGQFGLEIMRIIVFSFRLVLVREMNLKF